MNLSKRQMRILKELYPENQINTGDFKQRFGTDFDSPTVRTLRADKLITSDKPQLYGASYAILTEQGRAEHMLKP